MKSSKGVSTIVAIMVIIILGILGTVFVTLLNTEQYGYLNYFESAQSFENANAGAEWGLKQRTSTPSPIAFGGGTISVVVSGNTLTTTGVRGNAKRIVQLDLPAAPAGETAPEEGCEKYIISTDSSYSPFSTSFSNPVSGVGDIVYIKVLTTKLQACSGGIPTLDEAKIELTSLDCPNDEFEIDNVGSWSCNGPIDVGACTNVYEYTIAFNLPGGWSNTSAAFKLKLEKGDTEFEAYDKIDIGSGHCSSLKIYSDSGYTTEVDPWELEKGSTYYFRIITNNLNNLVPDDKAELKVEDYANNKVYENDTFFSLNGTQSITCGGSTYSYGAYDGNFTIPDAAPTGNWNTEPTADWWYSLKIKLENNNVSCKYEYKNNFKVIGGSGGGGGGGGTPNPLDEAASQASATQSTPGTSDWHGAQGGNDQFLIKLINETASDIIISSFDLSSDTSQPNLKHVQSSTAANGWNKTKIWDGDQSLPTGQINVNAGSTNEWTIPANNYIIIDDFHFQNDLNPGTWTLIVYFTDGTSSTLTFTL